MSFVCRSGSRDRGTECQDGLLDKESARKTEWIDEIRDTEAMYYLEW